MDLLTAAIYGALQGATEFLPISSTAHLRILPALMGHEDPGAAFTAAIQLGTLLAVFVYFFKDIVQVLRVGIPKNGKGTRERQMLLAVLLGSIPIVILGVAFKDQIEGSLRSLYVVATMLIVMALVLGAAEKFGKRTRGIETITTRDGIIVGLWQAVALIPGASRSGSTISGALFSGLDRAAAARFSFLLSIPSVLAAGIFSLAKHKEMLQPGNQAFAAVMTANAVSFVVGLAAIWGLIEMLKRTSTWVFIFYRLALGAALIFALTQGHLSP